MAGVKLMDVETTLRDLVAPAAASDPHPGE
jgi:hypothetical protein